MIESPVLFSEISATHSNKVATITLNAEKTLNSLTLEMVDLIYKQLITWQKDDSIRCIFIQGAGPKALCAGGDIQQLYQSAIDQPGGPCDYAESFFTREYRLNYLLHTYTKPIVCWGHGIVMGGGLGVLAGCSHRIVTEKTRMAMPEVTIGLFPDVGGSWFLNRMPGRVGLFLALTAAKMNAADCLFTGIADHFIESDKKDSLLQDIITIDWQSDNSANSEKITQILNKYEGYSQTVIPIGNVEQHYGLIQQLTDHNSLSEIVNTIQTYQSDNPWLSAATAALTHGSPISACNIYQALQLSKDMSLSEIFQFELMLATNIVRHPEFAEGVRALLIDKDKNPKWQYLTIEAVPEALLQQMVTPPWDLNPLADLK